MLVCIERAAAAKGLLLTEVQVASLTLKRDEQEEIAEIETAQSGIPVATLQPAVLQIRARSGAKSRPSGTVAIFCPEDP